MAVDLNPAELAAKLAEMDAAEIQARREEVERIDAEWAAKAAARGGRPKLAIDNSGSNLGPFALRPLAIRDQKDIPHRQWLYGTDLIRGFVTLVVAPGGTGKSSLILAIALAITTNRKLLKTHIHQQGRVALLNLEDPQHEIDRRVAALAQHYNIRNDEIDGRLFISPEDRKIVIARMSEDGFSIVHPDEDAIVASVRANQIDVLCVDPFAESHALEENSNPQMVQAAAAWRRVAQQGNCAVMLAHHVRKGPLDSIESARGAKALTDSARIGLLLSTMSEADAEALNVSEDQRLQYVRLDDAKANLAKRANKARWFRLSEVTLNNAQPPYRSGDEVGVVEAWEPPDDELKTAPNAELNAALDAIRDGPGGGILYRASKQGGGALWCGNVLTQMFRTTDKEATRMVKAWLHSGLLFVDEYRHPKWRRLVDCVRVNEGKRPTL